MPEPAVCFSFVGVQDKPMPEFCIEPMESQLAGSATGTSLDESRLFVRAQTLRAVRDRCLAAKVPTNDAQPDSYQCRTTLGGQGQSSGVRSATMRWVVGALRADFLARRLPPPQVLEVLLRRLGGQT